jgi:SAM-dependent methyltransferase
MSERFWSKVDRRGPDECWPWVGARLESGYGRFKLSNQRKLVPAHRFAWELENGDWPEGMFACHREGMGSMKLNIACGGNLFVKPWINLDLVDMFDAYIRHLHGLDTANMEGWPPEQVELSKQITAHNIVFKQHDLRKGFPEFEDGSVDACYVGQACEHLNVLHELPKLLAECFRLLRPGGAIRLTTPDLNKLLSAYAEGRMSDFNSEQPGFYQRAKPADQLSYLLFGAGGAGCTRDEYEGHFHAFTVETLGDRLLDAGFEHVAERPTPTAAFEGVRDYGMSHSFGIEGVKP